LFVLWGALVAGPTSTRAEDDLAGRIQAVLNGSDYKHSRWGILLVDRETKKVVFEHNADQLFAPASVTKLYSCAAALIDLGPDHKFHTPVYARGEVKESRLHGDLILQAQGDPSLGGRTDSGGRLAFKDHDHIYANWLSTNSQLTDTDPLAGLKSLAHQVKESGIHHVEGDVLIDDRLFDHGRGSGSGPVLLTPIVVNDNLVDVMVAPAAKVGEKATFQVRPQTSAVQVDVQVDTVAKGKPAQISVRDVGRQRFVVRGQIPLGSGPLVRICPVDDPAGFARALLIEALQREGVTVHASALAPPSGELPDKAGYERLKKVAEYTSPPLSEVLKVTLKVSHNLYASLLPLLVATKHGKRTLPEGMRLQGEILTKLGVDVASISLESGAGGGNGDRVTPRATVQLLLEMAKRPDFAIYKEALPVLGVDGTLVDAIKDDSPARGKIQAKTGTYGDEDLLNGRMYLRAKSLAGVMTTAKGRSLAICLFVNDVPLPKGITPVREAKVLGRLGEIIYQHAP
jgi:D-alanyl-D-alanine carboxypeptidase/D-alanyl-D-alanine-endopeptidase (penicillin-binding protein 4)